MPHPVGAADVDDGRTRWRAEDAFEIRCPAWFAGLQQGEDAASVIVGHDDGQIRFGLMRADEQTVAVVQESQVAHQRVCRSGRLREGKADSCRNATINASQPAVGRDCQGSASRRRRHGQVDITHGVGRPHEQCCLGRHLGQDRGRDSKPARPGRLDDLSSSLGNQIARVGPLPRPLVVDLPAVRDG